MYVNPRAAGLLSQSRQILAAHARGERSHLQSKVVPVENIDGTEIKTVGQASALMNCDTITTALFVMEQKAHLPASLVTDARAALVMEEKVVRKVRTAAGVRRYKQPIGSVIVRDGIRLDNLTIDNDQSYANWTAVTGKNGTSYQVGKDDGKWYVTRNDSWDDIIVDGVDTEEEAFEALNSVSSKKKHGAVDPKTFRKGTEVRQAKRGETLTANQRDAVSRLSDAQRSHYKARRKAGDSHVQAMRNARSQGMGGAGTRTRKPTGTQAQMKREFNLTDAQLSEVTGLDERTERRYITAREAGHDHAGAMGQAKGTGRVTKPSSTGKAPNSNSGKNIPPAVRLGKKQQQEYDDLGDAEKEKYNQARRSRRTHQNAMVAATKPDMTRAQQAEFNRLNSVQKDQYTTGRRNGYSHARAMGLTKEPKKIGIHGGDSRKGTAMSHAQEAEFNRLTSAQKAKYTAARRDGKNHTQAVKEARGLSTFPRRKAGNMAGRTAESIPAPASMPSQAALTAYNRLTPDQQKRYHESRKKNGGGLAAQMKAMADAKSGKA